MSVSWPIASLAAARFMGRTSYRRTAILSCLALVAGCALLLLLTPARGVWWAALGSFVLGIGMGGTSTVFIVSIQAAVPWNQRGAATSSAMFLRFVGQSLGAAAAGAAINATIFARDPAAIGAVDRLLDPIARAGLSAAETARLAALVATGIHNAYWIAAAFGLVSLLLAILLPRGLSPVRPG